MIMRMWSPVDIEYFHKINMFDIQELIIKIIINNHGNSYSNNKHDLGVAGQTTPMLTQATERRGRGRSDHAHVDTSY